MKKINIILIIFNAILTIALIAMILLYLNAIKMSKNSLESQLTSANEVFELNKKVQELEEEIAGYKNSEIKTVTNTLTTNIAVLNDNNSAYSTEPYIPDGMSVAAPNDNTNSKASGIEFNRKPENVTIEVLEDTITNTSVEILITDNNEDKYGWGVPFAIQEKINGEWKNLEHISDRVAWITIAYNLDKNNQLKQTLDIEEYYGKLEPGIYRVVKPVYDKENIDLYSNEFVIK